MRRVRDHRKYQDALVNVKSRLGVTEHLISVGGDGINLGSGININIVGIQKFELDGTPYCEHCNRGDRLHDRVVPQARLAIYAPIKYEIVRHDARKKNVNEHVRNASLSQGVPLALEAGLAHQWLKRVKGIA